MYAPTNTTNTTVVSRELRARGPRPGEIRAQEVLLLLVVVVLLVVV